MKLSKLELEDFRKAINKARRSQMGLRKYYDDLMAVKVPGIEQAEVFFIPQQELCKFGLIEKGPNTSNSEKVNYGLALVDETRTQPLDLPFQTVLLETDFGFCEERLRDFSAGEQGATFSIYVHERTPGNYFIATFCMSANESTGEINMHSTVEHDPGRIEFAVAILKNIFNRSSSVTFGEERVSISFPKPEGSAARGSRRNINRITHVVYGKQQSPRAYQSPHGGRVEWDHSWTVRGHWRRVPTIGKDRQGNPGIAGFTWVVDHVKGNATGGVTTKLRVIKMAKAGAA